MNRSNYRPASILLNHDDDLSPMTCSAPLYGHNRDVAMVPLMRIAPLGVGRGDALAYFSLIYSFTYVILQFCTLHAQFANKTSSPPIMVGMVAFNDALCGCYLTNSSEM